MAKDSRPQSCGALTEPGDADAGQVVAQQVDDHDVLGAILAAFAQRLRLQHVDQRIVEARPRALDRARLDARALDAQKPLRRGRRDDEVQMVEKGRERRRIDAAQPAVEAEMIEILRQRRFETLRQIGLEDVARENALDHARHRPLVAGARKIAGPALDRNRPRRRCASSFANPSRKLRGKIFAAFDGPPRPRRRLHFRQSRREDEAAPLQQIEGDDDVIEAEGKIGEGEIVARRRRQPFEAAAKLIGKQPRRAALKRRQAGQIGRPVVSEDRFQPPDPSGVALLALNGLEGIGGDEAVAAEPLVTHRAVEKCEERQALKRERRFDGIAKIDFDDMHEKVREPAATNAPPRRVFPYAKWRSSAAATIPGGNSFKDFRAQRPPRDPSARRAKTPCAYLASFGFSAGFGVSAGLGVSTGLDAGAEPSFGAGVFGSGGLGRPL